MSPIFWVEASRYAEYLYNMMTTTHTHTFSPYELVYRKRPRFDRVRVFGCDVYEHVEQPKVPGGQKARKGYFMGVPMDSPAGFLMYDIQTGTIRTVFSATFDESMVRRRCNIRVYDKAREIFTLQRQGISPHQSNEVVEELVFGEPDDQLTYGIIRRHFKDEANNEEHEVMGNTTDQLNQNKEDEHAFDEGMNQQNEHNESEDISAEVDEGEAGEAEPSDSLQKKGKTIIMTPIEAKNIIADARDRDLMLKWDQLNPKSGKSQVRYEYYKSLRTFKDVKEAVASGKMYSGDLKNDVERGLCVFEEPNACEGKANDTSSQSNKRKNSELLSVKIDDGREESISEDMKISKDKCYQSKPRALPDVHRHSRVTRRSLKMQQLEDDMEELSNQEGRHFIDRRV